MAVAHEARENRGEESVPAVLVAVLSLCLARCALALPHLLCPRSASLAVLSLCLTCLAHHSSLDTLGVWYESVSFEESERRRRGGGCLHGLEGALVVVAHEAREERHEEEVPVVLVVHLLPHRRKLLVCLRAAFRRSQDCASPGPGSGLGFRYDSWKLFNVYPFRSRAVRVGVQRGRAGCALSAGQRSAFGVFALGVEGLEL